MYSRPDRITRRPGPNRTPTVDSSEHHGRRPRLNSHLPAVKAEVEATEYPGRIDGQSTDLNPLSTVLLSDADLYVLSSIFPPGEVTDSNT